MDYWTGKYQFPPPQKIKVSPAFAHITYTYPTFVQSFFFLSLRFICFVLFCFVLVCVGFFKKKKIRGNFFNIQIIVDQFISYLCSFFREFYILPIIVNRINLFSKTAKNLGYAQTTSPLAFHAKCFWYINKPPWKLCRPSSPSSPSYLDYQLSLSQSLSRIKISRFSLTTSSTCHMCNPSGAWKRGPSGQSLKRFHGSDDGSGICVGGGSTFSNCWAPGATGTLWLAGAFSRSLFPLGGGLSLGASPSCAAAPCLCFLLEALLAFLQSIPLPNC